jgi:hypothetical protein
MCPTESPNDDQCNQSESGNKTGVYGLSGLDVGALQNDISWFSGAFCLVTSQLGLKFQLYRLQSQNKDN